MAQAEKLVDVVEEVVEVEVEQVVLTLDMDEAQCLRDILRFIGGHPDRTRRGLAEAIAVALHPHTRCRSPEDVSREEKEGPGLTFLEPLDAS